MLANEGADIFAHDEDRCREDEVEGLHAREEPQYDEKPVYRVQQEAEEVATYHELKIEPVGEAQFA